MIDIVRSADRKMVNHGTVDLPKSHTIISDPSVIVDVHGHLLVWHLPGMLSAYTEVCLYT